MSIANIDYIKELAMILSNNGLTKIDVSNTGESVVIERGIVSSGTPVLQTAEYAPEVVNIDSVPSSANPSVIVITSPLVGVFYDAPSPESEPFVKVGDTVKRGDIICIIEAMKFMNEVTAEQGGAISEVCLKNGDLVEFGQIIFKMQIEQ